MSKTVRATLKHVACFMNLCSFENSFKQQCTYFLCYKSDTCWISFAPVFSSMYWWVLIFPLSHFYTLIHVFWELMHVWVRGLSSKPNTYVPSSKSEQRMRLAPWNRLKPSSKIFLLTVPRRYFFCGSFVFCLLIVRLSRLFIAAFWSPAGKGLTSWLLFVMFKCVFVLFPCGIVLDCIDSWSSPPFLLCNVMKLHPLQYRT